MKNFAERHPEQHAERHPKRHPEHHAELVSASALLSGSVTLVSTSALVSRFVEHSQKLSLLK